MPLPISNLEKSSIGETVKKQTHKHAKPINQKTPSTFIVSKTYEVLCAALLAYYILKWKLNNVKMTVSVVGWTPV